MASVPPRRSSSRIGCSVTVARGVQKLNKLRTTLNEQVAREFAASQQYVAIAVSYDAQTLPRLAGHFYRQAVEERNHAMMIVQYLLDADVQYPDEVERDRLQLGHSAIAARFASANGSEASSTP
jgi:ferritin-like protein